MMRAEPTRRASRPARIPPAMPPIALIANSTPVKAGWTCSTRIRKTIPMAMHMPLNRFAVPVQATILRRIGCLTTNFRPSAISARRFRCSGAGSGRCSLVLMANSDATDTTYEMASAHIAVAAPTAPTRPPPRPGPANWANAWVAPSLPLPSIRFSGLSSTGR